MTATIKVAEFGNSGMNQAHSLSDVWWCRFKERQEGKLVLRKGDNTSFL